MSRVHLDVTFMGGVAIILVAAGFVLTAGSFSSSFAKSLRFTTPFKFTPFTVELPRPGAVTPVANFTERCSLDLPAGVTVAPAKYYEITMEEKTVQIIPGVNTKIWGYNGFYPGPSFKVKHNEPAIVRFHNDLNATTIPHNHGGHTPSLSDGAASVDPSQLIPPNDSRDFCYPNIAPVEPGSTTQELSDFSSTQWYHDHAHLPDLDLGITGQNVYMGLAGFYLLTDEIEQQLIDDRVLPSGKDGTGNDVDIPLVFQDRVFAPDGQLIFDVGDFSGVLGDVFVVNGKAQPKVTVERRKYRFRILNGSNARFWELRLTAGEFLQIGADSWLLGEAVTPVTFQGGRRDGTIRLAPAERADVVIDFSKIPNGPDGPGVVYIENILQQTDGRKPDGVKIPGTKILKFEVKGDPVQNDVSVAKGTLLRPHVAIRPDEIVKTRNFEFHRSNGHWQVNGKDFDPHEDNAFPAPGTAERWIIKNGGGGWFHPIHIHMEGQQIQKLSSRPVAPQEKFLKDTVNLGGGESAEVFIKFRTFTGRYVFHCHNIEHEDLAMMLTFNVGDVDHEDFSTVAPGAPGSPPALVVPGK